MRLSITLLILLAIPAAAQMPPGARLEVVAGGLNNPWGVGFAPDGRIFVSERTGRIRLIQDGRLQAVPWLELPIARGGPGLLGLALAPNFANRPAVYVVGGFPVPGAGDSAVFQNRLLRIPVRDGRPGPVEVLLDRLPSNRAHAGSAVTFGPDGMLYVTLGDAFRPAASQHDTSYAGKILRLTPDGRVPGDNPVPGSPILARGLRNTQGLAWHPETRALFATEHGPSGWPWEDGRRDHDELNQIVPGGNYGWPEVAGMGGRRGYIDPLVAWTPAIAPSGLAFYTGPYRPWQGQLFLGALRGRHLRRLSVARGSSGEWRVTGQETLLVSDSVRIRGTFMGPDGMLYLTTSDRRTAGQPDDRLYRIRIP
jgi:quinoprotein glucose dehydrogenase